MQCQSGAGRVLAAGSLPCPWWSFGTLDATVLHVGDGGVGDRDAANANVAMAATAGGTGSTWTSMSTPPRTHAPNTSSTRVFPRSQFLSGLGCTYVCPLRG